MFVIRPATAADAWFLQEMLTIAVDWRGTPSTRSVRAIMSDPALSRYIAGWPRPGDVGFVADERGVQLGAAWLRLFTEAEPGYGFVDESTPELSIAVVAHARGRGLGSSLLRALIVESRLRAVPAISLSVERDNPALALYERLGFQILHRGDGAITMALSLDD
jgi:ribosomal protein S18 acetylase RimI-like enzyme